MPSKEEIIAAMQAYAKWHIPEHPRPTHTIVHYMLEAAEKVRNAASNSWNKNNTGIASNRNLE